MRHLALVGLMGAGKTSVGRRCAERLGRGFVDTDEMVEATTGANVAEIFERDGEPRFRELERRAVADACASPSPLVIACGGGVVTDATNRAELRAHAFVVWLRASPAVLGARVGAGEGRPLLTSDGPGTLERLARVREPSYEAVADAIVDTDDRDLDWVAAAVVKELDPCAA
jgi:shikimate kinase